jgi:hypothetical protein
MTCRFLEPTPRHFAGNPLALHSNRQSVRLLREVHYDIDCAARSRFEYTLHALFIRVRM